MKPNRPGRKEAKQAHTVNERQTYKRHKAASRNRTFDIRDFTWIFVEFGIPAPADLKAVIDQIITAFRHKRVEPFDYGATIFDPGLTDLRELPIGLLDYKEEALPPELLPDNRNDLLVHCERLIIRNRNEQLVDAMSRPWPIRQSLKGLQAHVTDLWRLRAADPVLYKAIVCSQHDKIRWHRERVGLPRGFGDEQLIAMLVHHGLLWCANDIQMILSRNHIAEKNPFGTLISTDHVKLDPTGVVNGLKPHYLLLRILLQLYVTSAEEKTGMPLPGALPDDPIADLLRIGIERHAQENRVDLMTIRERLDAVVPQVRRSLAKAPQRLRSELEKPVTANELEKSFHAIWFAGLSNLQAAAVPLLRYVQAESGGLETLVRDRLLLSRLQAKRSKGVALPTFNRKALPKSWPGRIKDLLYLYRRELLDDADFRGKDGTARSSNAGWTAIEKAADVLEGERYIPGHAGAAGSRRRTFDFLDIIPEARLTRLI